jgi:hypothetical protein
MTTVIFERRREKSERRRKKKLLVSHQYSTIITRHPKSKILMQSFHRNHVNWFLAARRLAPLEEHGRLLYAPATSCFLIIFYID